MSAEQGRSSRDQRAETAERLLRERGIEGARVSSAGNHGEIASVQVSMDYFARLAELAPEIKALGFLYVALELAPDDSQDPHVV